MRYGHKFLAFFTVLLFVCSFLPLPILAAATIIPPDIVQIKASGENANRPLILGLTPANTEVLIYIDGRLAGMASVNREGTATDNFYFQPGNSYTAGRHVVFAVAKDLASLVLSAPSLEREFYSVIPSLDAPTMIQPNETTVTGKVKPFLTGLTVNGTKVHVFIDGVLNGRTEIVKHPSGTANFVYRPFLNLSTGWHTAWSIAENEAGHKSPLSNILRFRIESPLPAPTLLKTVVNQNTNSRQPFLTGVAKNDSTVKVFIDKKLNGTFKVKNSPTGTANFAYKPFLPLISGSHLAYATAVDSRGKESVWSNIIYFTVGQPAAPQISEEAAEEQQPVSEEVRDFVALAKLYAVDKSVSVSESDLSRLEELLANKNELNLAAADLRSLENLLNGKKAEEEAAAEEEGKGETPAEEDATSTLDEIEDIISGSSGTTTQQSGLIDESKEQQSKLRLNLIIFILFLIAVVVWIFWVNRELIKERRERNLAEGDEAKKKKDPDDMFKN